MAKTKPANLAGEGPVAMFGDDRQLTPPCVRKWIDSLPPSRQADYLISCEFLKEYSGGSDTFSSYRREVERFLQWLWRIEGKSLPEMRRDDIHAYMAFIESPPANFCADATRARFLKRNGEWQFNPRWRPFLKEKNLSNNSRKAMLAILRSYFNYLAQESHIDINPVSLIRQKSRYIRKEVTKRVTRKLGDVHWGMVIASVREDLPLRPQEAERALFLFNAFYLMALRISEVSEVTGRPKLMGDFSRDSQGKWWYTVTGKGNKEREVPVNNDMLSALKRYRLSRGLSALPFPGEETPLLENFTRKQRGLTSRMVRHIVEYYFNQAVNRLQESDPEEASHMARATVHWLRHTSISDQVQQRDKVHVQHDAGHADSKTTDKYTDTFPGERHDSMQDFRWKE